MVFGLFSQKSIKSFALVAIGTISLCLSGAVQADPACDATFMNAMKQKAWMEAQREIMIAQSVIAKPDSVFALGCFGAFRNSYLSSITFSNSTGYANGVVTADINNYLGASFNHAYGGGHDPNVGSPNTLSNNCALMLNLWNDARCSNLSMDKIQTLLETSTEDGLLRGAFPASCGNAGPWATPLNTFSTKVASKSVGAAFDDMNLFLGVTAPLSQIQSGQCAAGIPTGVMLGDASNHEIVCPNPGCVPNGQAAPKCCKADNKGKTTC